MIKNLPSQLVWYDFKTIDWFYKIEPLNKRFHEVLKTIAISLFEEKKDDTKVFNEVYYQMTRMAYERALPTDLQRYEKEIREDMGSNDAVNLVMSMAYHIMSLVDKDSRQFNSFLLLTIKERYENCPYWKPFSTLYTRLSKGKRRLKYDFQLRPFPANLLSEEYINWQEITGDFNAGAILEILNLWNNDEDKKLLLEMISTSVKFTTPKLQQTYHYQVEPTLIKAIVEKEKLRHESSELEKRIKNLDSTVMILRRENAVFQKIISDLQSENQKMKSLLEENKQDGSARKLTFVEMINYCKNGVEWGDVKEIVNMLNTLLRGIGTTEDYDLLDSVRTHFKNKKNGDTVSGNKTSVGDYSNMVNFVLPQNVDYDKLFNAIPPEIKDMWRKQIIQKDNG